MIAADPTVLIVVVTYDNALHISACLNSLVPQIPDDGSSVVVYDNASSDGTADLVDAEFGATPAVRLVRGEENLGFARAVNRAATGASSYLLLLNPDTVVEAGCVDALIDLARRSPDAGLYGGRTFALDGSFDPKSCWGRPTLWSFACFALGLSSMAPSNAWLNPEGLGGWRRDDEREVDIISGCLLLADRALWERLGGFDERFYIYGEDADLSLRAIDLGHRPMITPAAQIMHHVGASSPSVPKHIMLYRGKATLVQKIWSPPRQRVAMALLLAGVWLRSRSSAVRALLPAAVGSSRTESSTWVELWERRDEWVDGWAHPPRHSPCATLDA